MNKYFLSVVLLLATIFNSQIHSQDLISTQYLGELSKTEMQAFYGQIMQNGIKRYKVTYTTKDVHGVIDTASGLIVVPIREEAQVYPLLCYQHGTVDDPNDVPSNLQGGSALATVWGGLGYITAAADYLGLGESRGFHPYVHAATEASAAIDLLFATRQFVSENGYFLNDQLFITGYSQGGHAAAAVQKEIQENFSDAFTITASAPMSGPYSISSAMVGLTQVEEPYYFLGYLVYTVLSMNLAYDLGYEMEEIFKPPYIGAIQSFYNREIGVSSLHSQLTTTIATEVGTAPFPRIIFQDSVLLNMAANPNHPLNVALRDNDLFDWTPTAPTRLYYCMADDQVPFRNSVIADSIMNINGAPDVMAVDVNSNFNHGQCVNPAITQGAIFFLQYQSITTDTKNSPKHEPSFLFPNPGNGKLQFQQSEDLTNITVYDIEGQLQYQLNRLTDGSILDISHLPKGLYFLRWNTRLGENTQRIIIE